MLTKLNDYKGVIIFYILLALILMIVSYHNKQIDMKLDNQNYIINQWKNSHYFFLRISLSSTGSKNLSIRVLRTLEIL